MRSAAIITAAGSGSRMGLETNKVLLPFKNKTVIETAVQSFVNTNQFQKIIITHSPEDLEQLQSVLKDVDCPIEFVEGGSTRQQSVFNGLKQLIQDNPETVLIHDAARPNASEQLLIAVLEKAENTGSAAPVIPSVNAMKKIDSYGRIIDHLNREQTVSAQTPQGFNFKKIFESHKQAESEGYSAIDDTEIWDRYNNRVSTVPGELSNIKITYQKDLLNL